MDAACQQFTAEQFRLKTRQDTGGSLDFPVLARDGRVVSSLEMSETLRRLPAVAVGTVYVEPSVAVEASHWLEQNRDRIVAEIEAEDES
jgi:hypothetical protein